MGAGLTRSVGVDANGNPVVRQYQMFPFGEESGAVACPGANSDRGLRRPGADGQGSVLAITDGLGNVVTGYTIDAWGNVLGGSSPGNAFDFLGGLGLCYIRSLISRGEVRVGTGFRAEWIHSGRP